MSTAIAAADPRPPITETGAVLQVIERAARDPSVDIEKMRSLLQMHQEIRARDAETAFNAAMKDVQGEVGPVLRDKANDHTHSRYARLETIIAALNPISTSHGFSMSFGTNESTLAGHYRVTCDVLHAEGHKRHYFADVPSDLAGSQGKANKNAIQAFGSAMTYARRYLTTMIFNIAIADEDDDGSAAGQPGSYWPPKRKQADISAHRKWKRGEYEMIPQDLADITSIEELEKYEREVLTPHFMGKLGDGQFAVQEWVANKRKELTDDSGSPHTKADYIRECHDAIDGFTAKPALLAWWNSPDEKKARREYALTKDELAELMARVHVRCEEIEASNTEEALT